MPASTPSRSSLDRRIALERDSKARRYADHLLDVMGAERAEDLRVVEGALEDNAFWSGVARLIGERIPSAATRALVMRKLKEAPLLRRPRRSA